MANDNGTNNGPELDKATRAQPLSQTELNEIRSDQFQSLEAFSLTTSFTGTDCLVYAVIPPDFESPVVMRGLGGGNPDKSFWGSSPYLLGALQTISYSSHRPAYPIIPCGHIRPVAYTNASRTIGGTMIFNIFDFHPLVEIYKNYFGIDDNTTNKIMSPNGVPTDSLSVTQSINSNNTQDGRKFFRQRDIRSFAELADELPPIDLHIIGVNEQGHTAYMALHRCKFIDESMTISIQDLYTEMVVQFLCSSLTPFQGIDTSTTDRAKRFGELSTVITGVTGGATYIQELNEEAINEPPPGIVNSNNTNTIEEQMNNPLTENWELI